MVKKKGNSIPVTSIECTSFCLLRRKRARVQLLSIISQRLATEGQGVRKQVVQTNSGQTRRMAWVEKDLLDGLVSTTLPCWAVVVL